MNKYLNYYLKEKEELLNNPETFREKYPGWQENLRVKDILKNIEAHIKHWEKEEVI